jgi:hypothetical protein
MNDLQLKLTEDERVFLLGYLEDALKGTLVEEHRTRKPTYREIVVRQEKLIEGLLSKIKALPT